MISQKYKILYLTYHPDIGGGETILLSLLGNLDKKIFEPIVIITKKGQLSEKLKSLKVVTHILPLPGYLIRTFFVPGMSPIGIYKTYQLIKSIKPDIIHLNHLNLAVYSGIAAKILRIPVIATAHGSWDSIYFFQDIITKIFVDKILANTPQTAKNLAKRKILDARKVKVIFFGVDTTIFKPANQKQTMVARKILNLPQKNLIITIVGRLDPVKDHMTFLKGAKLVHEKLKNVTFYIVGSKLGDFTDSPRETGQSSSYEKQIKDYLSKNPALAEKIIFGGFIEFMPTVYK